MMTKNRSREMYRNELYELRQYFEFADMLVGGPGRDIKTHYYDSSTDDSRFRVFSYDEINPTESSYEYYHICRHSSNTSNISIMIEKIDLYIQSISVDVIKTIISAINILNDAYESEEDYDAEDSLEKIVSNSIQNLDDWFTNENSYIFGSYALREVLETDSLQDSLDRVNISTLIAIIENKFSIYPETVSKILMNPDNVIDILIDALYSNLNFINELTCGDYMTFKKLEISV